jgi:cytochrome c551/c552
MEFLKEIALPQPIEHFHLLLFILNLTFILFLPYFGFLLGTSVLSVYYHRRACRTNNSMESRFAHDLILTGIFTKSGVTFFALLPALALVFLFAQLLQGTPAIAAGVMAFGFMALLSAVILLYAFRFNIVLERLLSATSKTVPGATEYRQSTQITLVRTGQWGVVCILIASALCMGAISITVNRESWYSVETLLDLLLSPDFWVRYLHFLAVSLGATGIGVLFFFFEWEGGVAGQDTDYQAFVRPIALRMTVVSLLAQPVLMLASIALLPPASLTGLVFGLSGLSLGFLLLTASFLYAYRMENRPGYVAYAFFALGLAVFLVFTKDQVAISNATKDHASILAVKAEREVDELKAKLGVAAIALSGEDIYNGKCSACHLFDQKKIGPPYQVVIAKYAGRRNDLIRFILNPSKVDPAYPSMPNQGLKATEADSIATYLLTKVIRGSEAAPPKAVSR